MSDNISKTQRLWAFVVYSVAFESLIWGIFAYAVFWQDHAGWWFFAAVVLSASQFRPKTFGLKFFEDEE